VRYRVRHLTRYRYKKDVGRGINLLHLRPRDTGYQHCEHFRLLVSPSPEGLYARDDYFGNNMHHMTVSRAHRQMKIFAESIMTVNRGVFDHDELSQPSCAQALALMESDRGLDTLRAREFRLPSPLVPYIPEFVEYSRDLFTPDTPLATATHALTQRIFREFIYDSTSTTLATPVRKVLDQKRGVCQDFAQVAIGCLRSHGFAARYVSGFIETLPPPGKKKLVGADATHAWFAVYVPGHGWLEYDPTNNTPAHQQHITTAWGRDYTDVTPIKGVLFGGGGSNLRVSVDVARLDATPASATAPAPEPGVMPDTDHAGTG
jgi:transglutaminase-like putative cysteine protease